MYPLRPLSLSLFSLWPSVSSTAVCPPLKPYVPSLAPLHDILYFLWPYVPSMVLCPLWPSPPSTALCSISTAIYPLYGPLSPLQLFSSLWPSVPSGALCPLYGPLSPLQPSAYSMALCSLYGSLSPLRPSVPSEKWAKQAKRPSCFANVLQNAFHQNSKGYCNLFHISDNRDYRDNHDYHSSKILSDNREIAIIALTKKVAIIAIITSNKKR